MHPIESAAKMLFCEPYQFQMESAKVLWDAKYALSADEMGLGKSLQAILCALAHLSERRDAKIIICVPAFLKANWEAEIAKFTLHVNVRCCHVRNNIPEHFNNHDIIIINYEQLRAVRHLIKRATMLVADECFVAGTLVDTPNGKKKIEDVDVGDKILNCSGEDEVVFKNISTTNSLVRINNNIQCTENHPFFTQRGWVNASSLRKGDYLVRTSETMRMVQGGDVGEKESFLRNILLSEMENETTRYKSEDLQQRSNSEDSSSEYRAETSEVIRVAQEEQLHVQKRVSGKSECHSSRDESPTTSARWKWARPNKARKNGNGDARARVGLQSCRGNEQARIQNRRSEPKKENSDRSRWSITLPFRKKSAGCEERPMAKGIRVESITFEKCRNRTTYNIQVKNHPSYSVGGVLVHNCHYLKNYESKRTQFFANYIHDNRPDRVILLSGTPIKNRVPEFFSLLKILDMNNRWQGARLHRGIHSFKAFCNHFCHKEVYAIPGKSACEIKYVGFKNEEELFELLKNRYIRHMADDVLELPSISQFNVLTRKLPPPGEDALEGELRLLWEQYLLGINSSFLASKKMENALLKVPYTIEFVSKTLEEDLGPIVVFTDHVPSARILAARWGSRAAVITGETPIPARNEIVRKFQAGEIDVMVATTGTMSAGWTLTKASIAVFNDLPWVPGDYMQAIKRIHRIGQKKRCRIYNIVTTELDRMIMNKLQEKSAVLKDVLRTT